MKRLPYWRPTSIRRRRTKHSAQRLDARDFCISGICDLTCLIPGPNAMVTKQQFCSSRESNCIPHTCTRYGAAISEFLYGLITSTLHKNYRFHYPEFGFFFLLSKHARHTVQSGMCCSTESDNTVRVECGYTQQTTNGVPGTLSDRTTFLFISYPAVRTCCKSSHGAPYPGLL